MSDLELAGELGYTLKQLREHDRQYVEDIRTIQVFKRDIGAVNAQVEGGRD